MTTYGRRQQLVQLLRSQPGLRVPDIARALGVSQGTVRNDLDALARTGELVRVRGGAIVENTARGESAAFSMRAQVQAEAKQNVARAAARLVCDGDSLLFDASTTAYYLALRLLDRHNLTIVTNGVSTARALAADPSNTVILLGGVMRADGTSTTGPISEQILQDLHVKTAFLSATALAVENGFYEVDLREAQLKRKMIVAAGRVIGLIDSSKFGKLDLAPFARLDQISHLFIDDGLDARWLEPLRQAGASFTLCGPDSVSSYAPTTPELAVRPPDRADPILSTRR